MKYHLNHQEVQDVGSVYQAWNDVYVLKYKPGNKELDPRSFDEKE